MKPDETDETQSAEKKSEKIWKSRNSGNSPRTGIPDNSSVVECGKFLEDVGLNLTPFPMCHCCIFKTDVVLSLGPRLPGLEYHNDFRRHKQCFWTLNTASYHTQKRNISLKMWGQVVFSVVLPSRLVLVSDCLHGLDYNTALWFIIWFLF